MMRERVLNHTVIVAVTALIGLGLAAALLLLLGAWTGSAVAAPPASNPPAPALNVTAGITIVKTAPLTVYQALGAGTTLITYVLTIQNPNGYTITAGAMVTDALPAGTSLLSGTAGLGWFGDFPANGTVVTYSLGGDSSDPSINVGDYKALLTVPVRDKSALVNTSYCFTGTVNGTTRSFCEDAPVTTTIRAPDFNLVEHHSAPLCAGGRVTYTLTVTNPGGVQTALPFTITGQITPVLNMLTDTISDGGTWTPYTVTWNVTSTVLYAEGGSQVTRTFAITIPAITTHGTPLTNTYTVTSAEVLPNISLWHSSGVTVTCLTAAFTSTTTACQNDLVTFQNDSTGATSYQWNFDDGSAISTQSDPTHQYTTTGTHTVVLTATGACGTAVATGTVTVHPLPTPILQIAPDPTPLGITTTFTDTGSGATTWSWNFGDGVITSTPVSHTTHIYTATGTYTATLTVTNSCGVDTDVLTVTVNCVPVSGADFTWDPASSTTTQTVAFTGAVPGGSPPVNYAWNWGDGTPAGMGNPAFHTFTVSGTYTVLMTATNTCGLVTATHAITTTGSIFTPTYGVELAPPTAAQSGVPGELVVYTLALTNTGDAADSFDVTRVISGEQWAATVVPTRTPTLPPDGAMSVIVGVSISTTAAADQQSFVTVTATSVMTVAASDSSVLTTTVLKIPPVYLPMVTRNYTTPGPPPMTLVASPIALVVGETSVLTATAFDYDGLPIPDLEVAFSTTDPLGSGALTTFGTRTNSSGQITATLRSTLAGLVRVTAQGSNSASDSTYLTFRSTSFCAPQLIAVAEAGSAPRKVALDTTGRRAFIAHDSGLTVMDLDTFAVITATQSVASAYGVAYDADHNRIWVARMDADRVVVLDGGTYAVLADLPAGDSPRDVAYNPTNDRVYVTNFGSWTVDVYNATAITLDQTLTNFKEPCHIAVNPNTNKIYVANHGLDDQLTVIRGDTHVTYRAYARLFDGFAVTVDTTRNLVYAASVAEARLAIIDGATDLLTGTMDIQRSDGKKMTLRSIAVNPNVGPEGHLFILTSSEYGGQDQLLLIPNGWPTLGTPVPLDMHVYPKEGLVLDPDTNRFWVTSVTSGLVSVVQDGTPACTTPFSLDSGTEDEFEIKVRAIR